MKRRAYDLEVPSYGNAIPRPGQYLGMESNPQSDRSCFSCGIRVARRFHTQGCGVVIGIAGTLSVLSYGPRPDRGDAAAAALRGHPTEIGAAGYPNRKDGSTAPSGHGIGIIQCHHRHVL